jgi:hypothetical protein
MTYAPPLPTPSPEISLHRNHCVALLRRYFCMSVEIGRLPAILGRECFRTRTQDYHVHSFENLVLFVIDVEHCLDRLDPFDRELIAHIVFEEYTQDEAARLMQIHRSTLMHRLPDVLDALSEMFLAGGLLPLPNYRRRQRPADEESGATGIDLSAAADSGDFCSDPHRDSFDDPAPKTCQAPFFAKFEVTSCIQSKNSYVTNATLTPSNLLC